MFASVILGDVSTFIFRLSLLVTIDDCWVRPWQGLDVASVSGSEGIAVFPRSMACPRRERNNGLIRNAALLETATRLWFRLAVPRTEIRAHQVLDTNITQHLFSTGTSRQTTGRNVTTYLPLLITVSFPRAAPCREGTFSYSM